MTYHAVAITDRYRVLAQSRGTLAQACEMVVQVYKQSRGRVVILRVGNTGERLSVHECEEILK